MDIIVTTPKNERLNAKKEAERILKEGGGLYFRRFSSLPTKLNIGDKVFYTEDGYIRGFATVVCIQSQLAQGCDSTGKVYPEGHYVFMDASTWKWIKPIAYNGFQGFRYFNQPYEIIGNWEDPMPIFV